MYDFAIMQNDQEFSDIKTTLYLFVVSLHATSKAGIPLRYSPLWTVLGHVSRAFTLVAGPVLTGSVEVSDETTKNANLHLLYMQLKYIYQN